MGLGGDTTVGEPIEPEVWRWYYNFVGKGEAAIVDTWWQTETGGFLGSTLPGLEPMKPGSCGPGVLGIFPVIYDGDGNEVPRGGSRAGDICIGSPWPGIITARTGTTGHTSLGTARCRPRTATSASRLSGSSTCTTASTTGTRPASEVAEAAAVPVIDDIRGRMVEMYISLKPGVEAGPDMEAKVVTAIETEIGKIARPKNVWTVPDMLKTRSGKIMRRVIAAVSNLAPVGDVTTLANPEVVDSIRHRVQRAKVARGDMPRELSATELAEIQSFGIEYRPASTTLPALGSGTRKDRRTRMRGCAPPVPGCRRRPGRHWMLHRSRQQRFRTAATAGALAGGGGRRDLGTMAHMALGETTASPRTEPALP